MLPARRDAALTSFVILIRFEERGDAFDFNGLSLFLRLIATRRWSVLVDVYTVVWTSHFADLYIAVALQDHTKRLNNPNASANAAASSDPSKPAEPKKDYSLKPGQSFTISVPGSSGRPKEKKAEPVGGLSAGGGLGGFMLPPPPSGRKR